MCPWVKFKDPWWLYVVLSPHLKMSGYEVIFVFHGFIEMGSKLKKSKKMVGDNFFSGPLTMLRRPVYAFDHGRCPKSGDINYCFLPLYQWYTCLLYTSPSPRDS